MNQKQRRAVKKLVKTTTEQRIAALQKNLATKLGVTKISLVNTYGPYAADVLVDLWVKERTKSRYVLTINTSARKTVLPTPEEFTAAFNKKFALSAATIIEDNYTEIESLAEEAREIYDNASGTSLENTQRIQTFGEAAGSLESISLPVLTDVFEKVMIVCPPSRSHRTGRSHRLGEAVSEIEMAVDAVDAYLVDTTDDSDDAKAFSEKNKMWRDDTDTSLTEIREHIGETQNVDLPSMYG